MTQAAHACPCRGCLRRWESKDDWECIKCDARYQYALGTLVPPPYPGQARSRREAPRNTRAGIEARIRQAIREAQGRERGTV